MTPDHETEEIVAESPGLDCPLCHREIHHDITAHLEEAHSVDELVSFVETYALEMEETRPSQ